MNPFTHLLQQAKKNVRIHDWGFLYQLFDLLCLLDNVSFCLLVVYYYLLGDVVEDHCDQVTNCFITVVLLEIKLLFVLISFQIIGVGILILKYFFLISSGLDFLVNVVNDLLINFRDGKWFIHNKFIALRIDFLLGDQF